MNGMVLCWHQVVVIGSSKYTQDLNSFYNFTNRQDSRDNEPQSANNYEGQGLSLNKDRVNTEHVTSTPSYFFNYVVFCNS